MLSGAKQGTSASARRRLGFPPPNRPRHRGITHAPTAPHAKKAVGGGLRPPRTAQGGLRLSMIRSPVAAAAAVIAVAIAVQDHEDEDENPNVAVVEKIAEAAHHNFRPFSCLKAARNGTPASCAFAFLITEYAAEFRL